MNESPLVSVIVVTYNRKELLKETIYSILNQTFEEFELIVVDNFSDYNFFLHIESFNDDRIKPFQNQNNGIIAVNRNFGINNSKGKYIAFCDDDDLWLPEKLNKQITVLEDSGCGMVCTMLKRFGVTNIFSKSYGIGPLPFRQKTSRNDLLHNNCISNSSVLVKKTILDEVGYFEEKRSFISLEDHDLWIRISAVTKIQFIPEVLLLYRIHKSNLRPTIVSDDTNKGIKEFYLKHGIKEERNQFMNGKNSIIINFLKNVQLFIVELLFLKQKNKIYLNISNRNK